MKRIILIISTLLFGLAVKAQSQYTCRYWYDGDVGSVVTTGFDGSNWQAQLDVGALDAGLHFLHLQVVESQQVCGPTRSYLFMKNPIFEIDDLTYCCWFDQDVEHQYTGAFGNGSFLLDVSNLRDGLHFVHVLLEGSTLTTAKSYLFMKDPIFEMEDLTYRCWFDQDVEHQYTGAFGNGSFLLDVSNLRDGLHFVHILLEGCTLTTAKSYLFMKLPTSDEDLQYHCWFDQNYSTVQNGPVGNGVFLLDVSGLPIGEHEVILQLDNGNFFSPRSYNFYRTPMITVSASPTEGGTATILVNDSICTLTATANAGYNFVNWTMDGNIVSTENVYSFTMTEDAAFVANFELGTSITQTTNFNNGWNWWSSYIELDSSSLQDLENGLDTSGEMIKSQNDGYASYLEGYGWYGSLTSINNESTYQVKTNAACTVGTTGSATNPEDHPITLSPGWTWVGYPVAVSMGVEDALAGITPQNGDMLKSQNEGYASYLEGYGWYGSLNTLQPGMGLMYKSNNANAVTLVYPNGGTRTDLKANQTAENNHWRPNLNAYPDNMSVMAVVELDGEELALRQAQGPDNYELAVFANGECRGSARLMYVEPLNRYMAFLTVAGDEAAELRFGLYNTETGEVETQCITSLQYETNAVIGSFAEPYVVRFRGNTGVDEWANNLNVFPNPVERGQKVSLGFNDVEMGEVQVEIINVLGTIVETRRAASLQTITAPETAGVYTLRITVEGKGTCYRKLVVE